MPFVTEAIWQQLNKFAPTRDLDKQQLASKHLMLADWPEARAADRNREIEEQFAIFSALLGAIREIRSRQNVPPKDSIGYSLKADLSVVEILKPMLPFIESMASANLVEIGDDVAPPAVNATVTLDKMTVYVDLSKLIDVDAEIQRNEKLLENLIKQIASKESKLSNDSFVARAPAAVVEKERASLNDLIAQRDAAESSLLNSESSIAKAYYAVAYLLLVSRSNNRLAQSVQRIHYALLSKRLIN